MTGENHPLGPQIELKKSKTRVNITRLSSLLELVNQKTRNIEEVTIF